MFEHLTRRLSALALSAMVTLTLLSGIHTLARSEHAGYATTANQAKATTVGAAPQATPRCI